MELKKYTKTRFEALKRQLWSYAKSPDVETLHKIRVEIKKIKTILKLANACVKKFKFHREYVPLRFIFRKAGRIREPELIYGLFLRYEIAGIPDGLVPQSLVEDSLSKEFQERIPSFLRTIEKREFESEKDLNKIHKHDVHKYVRKKLEELRFLLITRWNRGTLHRARKAAKEIIYLSALINSPKRDIARFCSRMEELIGLWHDKQLLIPILKESNSNDLERISRELRADFTRIKKDVSDFYDKR